jgi:hypothetical protein
MPNQNKRLIEQALSATLSDDRGANVVFEDYKRLGKLPQKYKTKESFLSAIKERMDSGKTLKEAADSLAKLDTLVKSKKIGKALETIDEVKYKGIPLKVNGKGEPVFDKRKFHEKPPERLKAWVDFLEEQNKLPKGFYNDFEKWAKKGWNAHLEKNKGLKIKTGQQFDNGHLVPSAMGGPNVPSNVRAERALGPGGNRSKGQTPNFATPQIPNELGIPENWTRAFYEYDLDRQGFTATGLPKDTRLSSAELARIELGTDHNKVISIKQQKIQQQLTNAALESQDLPKSHQQILARLQNNGRSYQSAVATGLTTPKGDIISLKSAKGAIKLEAVAQSEINGTYKPFSNPLLSGNSEAAFGLGSAGSAEVVSAAKALRRPLTTGLKAGLAGLAVEAGVSYLTTGDPYQATAGTLSSPIDSGPTANVDRVGNLFVDRTTNQVLPSTKAEASKGKTGLAYRNGKPVAVPYGSVAGEKSNLALLQDEMKTAVKNANDVWIVNGRNSAKARTRAGSFEVGLGSIKFKLPELGVSEFLNLNQK